MIREIINGMGGATEHFDVIILGGGLAGQTLARHLLLDTDKTVLLLEKRAELPAKRQKYGESSVQLAGYYYAKVLDLEEYLLREQFLKYNLRFYWKSTECDNRNFEDYSHSFIRPLSNIASYQLNRNTFEGEVGRRNLADPRFTLKLSVNDIDVDLVDEGPHRVRFAVDGAAHAVTGDWVVDTSGRARILARDQKLMRKSSIEHGAFFWWVDGLVDIEKLTDRSRKEIRLRPERKVLGHLPTFLATNHFCGEGLWFWVIPLQGKTSLGIVYDSKLIKHEDVFSVKKATEWVCREFPLFERDLPHRKVLDFGGLTDYAHDCVQTISPKRWAMAGEAGRFSDPLYSPGSDLISIYNTLIVDAIRTDDPDELESKCQTYEQMMRSVFQAYVPTYATSYDCLGDQEAFSFKYVWELTVYFAGYVFPFINDMFTDRRFLMAFMRLFGRLGPINSSVQQFLSDYYQWKKKNRAPQPRPIFFEFMEVATLARAEKTFYEVGVTVEQARTILADQVASLEGLARFIYAHVAAVVLNEDGPLTNRMFIEQIDPSRLRFDPEDMRQRFAASSENTKTYTWALDPMVARRFRTAAIGQPSTTKEVMR